MIGLILYLVLICSFRSKTDTFLFDKLKQSESIKFDQNNLYLSELNNKLNRQQIIQILNNYQHYNQVYSYKMLL